MKNILLNKIEEVLFPEMNRRRMEDQVVRLTGLHPVAIFRVDRINSRTIEVTYMEAGKVGFKKYKASPEFLHAVIEPLEKLSPSVSVRL